MSINMFQALFFTVIGLITPYFWKDSNESYPQSLNWSDSNYTNNLKSFEIDQNSINCDFYTATVLASAFSSRLKILRKGESPDIIVSSKYLANFILNQTKCDNEDLNKVFKSKELEKIQDTSYEINKILLVSKPEVCKSHFEYNFTKFENISGAQNMIKALQTGPILCYLNLNYDQLSRFKEEDFNEGQTGSGKIIVLVVGYREDNKKEEIWILKKFLGDLTGQETFTIKKGKNFLGIEEICYSMEVDPIIVQNFGLSTERFGIENYTVRANEINKECGDVSSYLTIKPVNRLLLVFGPSQSGKSSFIKSLIEAGGSANITSMPEVGIGNGESTTRNITLYNVGSIPALFPHDIQGFDTISVIDVPGTFDSGLKLTEGEILQLIQMNIIVKSISQIDCILVFESMNVDSRKVYYSVKTATELFGSNVNQSMILLTTKWDKVEESERDQTKDYIDSMAVALNISSMKWKNKIPKKNLINETDFQSQLSELGHRIQQVKKYNVHGMDDLIKERDQLAEKLRNEDPDRYSTTQENIEIDVPVEYTDIIEIDVFETVPLSQDEIFEKAKSLHKNQPISPDYFIENPEGKRQTKRITVKTPRTIINKKTAEDAGPHKIEIIDESVEYIEEEIDIDMGPELIVVKGKPVDLDYYINLIKNNVKLQSKKKQVEVKKFKT